MNLSKLNYILIPSTEEDRERFRNSRMGALFRFLFRVYFAFSDEGRIMLFVWMLGAALSVYVGFTQYYVVWSVMTGVLLASVLFRYTVRLRDVSMSFRAPDRVSVGEEMHLTIELHNQGDLTHQAIRVERPFLPWDGKYLSPRLGIPTLKPGEREQCLVKARFIARGEHFLDPAQARALAPLGFAMGPSIDSEGLHFLVIPKIAKVEHIQIDTTERYQPGGVALASITGESRELIGVRPYRPGDPIRDLHARTWARIGEPAVREYQQEYFTRIGLIIDTDGGVADEPLFESMLSLAAGLVAQLSRGELLLDLLVIGEDMHELTLGRSLGFLDQALDLLACVDPKHEFAPSALQSRLQEHLKRLSCTLFLSLKWDQERQAFADWIEDQGTRCRRIVVTGKKVPPFAVSSGATMVASNDILEDKELII